ncbi:MAG TPA: ATP-binding protein [Holophagaceae bacterium]|nr:ATP-binding protein [Holophagaceae bacterium]
MHTRIGTRLILAAGLVSAVVIGMMTVLIMRAHRAQLLAERTRSANQLSETIKGSTHFDMLENRRENLHRQIRDIGALSGEGIHRVRLFNKEGQIMFSSAKEEIGTTLDTRAEACFVCHAEGRPLEKPDIKARARIFRGADGARILGIISPIPNEPGCWTAACHAHKPEAKLLGVLDVNVSMAEADAELARSRSLMAGLAALAIGSSGLILWWLNRRLVVRPVAALLAGTRRVAEGDLNTVIRVEGRHELSELADAFNGMTHRLGETQRQLAQADKLASIGRLAAGIAHEINNPLTGVLTYASLLQKRLAPQGQDAEDMEVIVHETIRCRGIIRELLDFARPTPPSRKPTDLNEVARKAMAVVVTQLRLNHVSIALDLAQDLPLASADANQLQQVVVNLLLNAADASGPEGGEIRLVSRAAPPDFVELTVEDHGEGIPLEHQPHLFEPFFSTKGNKGTGLGLAVSWGIVESHGGTLSVQSEPGHGARFTLRIPLAPPAPHPTTPSPEEPAP